jgi:hypothetical protein
MIPSGLSGSIFKFSALAIFASGIFVFAGCKKEEEKCIAGTGGDVTLNLFPEHHGKAIPGIEGYPDSAFIKFNTKEYPGGSPSSYDLVIVGSVGSDMISAKNLKCGDYFIYMTGYDTSIAERVRGGIPYTISENASGVISVKVPITED